MTKAKTIDLDADLGLDNDDAPVNTRPFKLFGRTWTLVCDLNTFALSDLTTGEPAAVVRFLTSVVVEDERDDFRTAFATAKGLTSETLGKILTAIVEAATERPTSPPSDSGSGRKNPTSPRKSVATSSRVRAVR
jgi:hypothetical protein